MRLNSTCSGADSGRRTRRYSLLFLIASAVAAVAVSAADLRNVVSAEQEKLKLAQQSQERIDQLSDERKELYSQFKAVNKEIEGLKVYNKQLSKQIVNQRKEMERIRQTMEDVQVTQRQVVPQMLSMIEGLKQFVALDMPFLKEERESRIERLEELMDDSNVSVAEKFRNVVQAYQIESEYGSTIESYSRNLEIEGSERNVNILRFGRITMVYQTPDGKYSGFWNKETGQWEPAGSGVVRSNIEKGLKVADKQTAPDLVILPVEAPEAAQ